MEDVQEGDTILCTVKRIDGTTVFLDLENKQEGTLVTSEIAPGRIRNLREYVMPGKKIVCKVLSVFGKNIHLSLRRVTDKEKKQVLEREKKEKTSESIIKSIVKENPNALIAKIKEKSRLDEFLQQAKETPKILEEYFSKEQAEKLSNIIKEKKEKSVEVKKEFSFSSKKPEGILILRKILFPYNEEICYLGAGKYSIKIKSEDYKKANAKMQEITDTIEKQAKKEQADFKLKEK